MQKVLDRIDGKELRYFSLFSLLVLLIAAFASGTPGETAAGLVKIIISRDALITDYFELAGYGAAFLNAAMVLGLSIGLVLVEKIPFTTSLSLRILFLVYLLPTIVYRSNYCLRE